MERNFKIDTSTRYKPTTVLEQPGSIAYKNFLEDLKNAGEEATGLVNNHSKEVIQDEYDFEYESAKAKREKIIADNINLVEKKEVPPEPIKKKAQGYKLGEIHYPEKKDLLYEGKFIDKQLKKIVSSHPEYPDMKLVLDLAKNLKGPMFTDDSINTDQRKKFISMLHPESYTPSNWRNKKAFEFCDNNKLRGNKAIINPLRILSYKELLGYELLGDKFQRTEEIEKMYEELLPLVSSNLESVNYENYRKISDRGNKTSEQDELDKKEMLKIAELASDLSRAICIQMIENYKDEEQKA